MLFKKLDMLTEGDFELFRIPFESGRQTLTNIRKGLIFGVFLQALFGGLFVYAAADPVVYPGIEKTIFITISFIITTIIILLSVIYAIPTYYKKYQHIQYLAGSLMLLNVSGISLYFISMLIIKREAKITNEELFLLVGISLSLLIIFFIVTLIRFYAALKRGDFRIGTGSNYEERLSKDKKVLSKIPELVVGATGVLLLIRYAVSRISYVDTSTFIIVLLCFILPYFSVFMFIQSLITYYCKKRFASFNFDEGGNLYPLGSGDDG